MRKEIPEGEPLRSLRKYPHMMPEDTAIWQKFIDNGEYLPEQVWYDFHVGERMAVLPGMGPEMMRFANACSRKRIDVIGRRGDNYHIIEIKPNAGAEACGQAVMYAELLEIEYEVRGNIIPTILTNFVDQDCRKILDSYGVMAFEVGWKGKGEGSTLQRLSMR